MDQHTVSPELLNLGHDTVSKEIDGERGCVPPLNDRRERGDVGQPRRQFAESLAPISDRRRWAPLE